MFRVYLPLVYLLFLPLQFLAQTLIPNSGFENWQDFDTLNQGHLYPSKWTAANSDTLFMLGSSGIVRRSNFATRGNYSVQMIIDSGNNIYNQETLQNTFPFKGRPHSLRFFTNFEEPGNSATATIIFYALDTNSNWQPVGNGISTFGYTGAGWTEQLININYTDTIIPARCHISFDYPSNADVKKNISFYLDEVSFSTSTGFTEIGRNDVFRNFYPCPVNEVINLNLKQDATVQLVDMLGKDIDSRIFASGTAIMATDNLPNGLYLLHIVYKNGKTEIDKIIINHP